MITTLEQLRPYSGVESGRFLDNDTLLPLLKKLGANFKISEIGRSENDRPIMLIKLGGGKTKVFGWSQMHGNESTTTRALFHFFNYIQNPGSDKARIDSFTANYTLYLIPILNPDGAAVYSRENGNGIDLNRDAVKLTQKESQVLREQIDMIRPELCLNLHDQRTIYGLPGRQPATISFLAPAADKERSITSARMQAMSQIVKINKGLEPLIRGQVGRYDDSFNPNCIGDRCTQEGIPTILFEAGHYQDDYQRETVSLVVFYALLLCFDLVPQAEEFDYADYFNIPENNTKFNDVLIRNARIRGRDGIHDIGIQFREALENGEISFIPELDGIFNAGEKCGHKEIDAKGRLILINSQENLEFGEKVLSIVDESDENTVYYSHI